MIRVLWCICAGLLCTGCASDPSRGYSFQETYPSDVPSVRVPIFQNQSLTPGIELSVTEAVIKELSSTSIRVVQAPEAASTLTGIVREVRMRRLGADSLTGLVQEIGVEVVVDFEWKDNRSGKVLSARKNFSAADTFVPAQPTGERIGLAYRGAAQRLAQDIVGQMRSSW